MSIELWLAWVLIIVTCGIVVHTEFKLWRQYRRYRALIDLKEKSNE